MKRITIIVTKGAILGNIEGPRQVFTEVNQFMESTSRPALFEVQMAGLSKESTLNDGLYTISTEPIKNIKKTDLIIVPGKRQRGNV